MKFISPFNLYVLKLIQNKYYIGKTNQNVLVRYDQYVMGFGSRWTQMYKPIQIIEQFKSSNKFIEDIYTKKYMDLYGIQNVRGGSYCKIHLDTWQIKYLTDELATSNDLCFICGSSGHFASQCKNCKPQL